MLIVETVAKIKRMHFGQGIGIKTICRELNLSKKVVRKVDRSGATDVSY
jgi:DNA-binding transcriptional regulator LsrR (DeoR family)